MRKILVLFSVLCLTTACRNKYYEVQRHRRDSLHFWQWEEVIVEHARLDSTGQKATERTSIVARKSSVLEHRQQRDSVIREVQACYPQTKRSTTRGLGLVFVGLLLGCSAVLYWLLRTRLGWYCPRRG